MKIKIFTFILTSVVTITSVDAVILNPIDLANVSESMDRNGVGSIDGGNVADNAAFIREHSGPTAKIASFIEFDFSSITEEVQLATFSISFDENLNANNSLAVDIGRVLDDGVGGDSWNSSGSPGSYPLYDWAHDSADSMTLISNISTDAFTTYSVDVTTIVNGWVNGDYANNGLVLYGATEGVFNGAGFSSPMIEYSAIPEPSNLAAMLALITVLVVIRRNRNF